MRARPSPSPRAALVLALATVVASSLEARANGRFPQANELAIDPGDASHLVARATYGVLTSDDRGASFRWVCEDAVGYTGGYDPELVVAAGGALLAGLADGVGRSTDGACSWPRVAGPLAQSYVTDLDRDALDPAHLVAVTAPDVAGVPGAHGLFATSVDAGASWTARALPEDLSPLAVAIAPSRALRVYVSGVGADPRLGAFAISDDGGSTWATTSFDLRGARGAYVSAVDPNDPARVYLRVSGDAGDRLEVSLDGARTFRDAFAAQGELLGFALSPDGRDVAVGGPVDGLLVASSADLAFHPAAALHVRCLTWGVDGLYACADELPDGFSIGRSTDRGATFTALYHPRDLTELACASDSAAAMICPAAWPAVARSLGDPSDGGADGGALDAAPDARIDDAGGAPPRESRASCACSLAPHERRGAWNDAAAGAIVAAAAWVLRRARKATARRSASR